MVNSQAEKKVSKNLDAALKTYKKNPVALHLRYSSRSDVEPPII